LKIFTKLVTK